MFTCKYVEWIVLAVKYLFLYKSSSSESVEGKRGSLNYDVRNVLGMNWLFIVVANTSEEVSVMWE